MQRETVKGISYHAIHLPFICNIVEMLGIKVNVRVYFKKYDFLLKKK